MEWLTSLTWGYEISLLIVGAALVWIGQYVKKKLENVATKQDIGKITDETEKVRSGHAGKLHARNLLVEREFKFYEQLFESLMLLRDAALQMRPVFDVENSEDTDVQKRRLAAVSEAYSNFYILVNAHRPFYPEKIFETFSNLMKLVRKEAFHYNQGARNPGQYDRRYWDTAEENAEKIVSETETILDEVRDTLNSYR